MEGLKGSVFITAKEIQILTNCTRAHSFKEHQAIRDAFGIKSKRLLLHKYIEYIGADAKYIIDIINKYR